ncbi:serine hydrolase domain-containing protein [Sphingosinicella rhizophila]|uniref:Serine hydrolase domain-containing protein n=1 Tax=Sphingosinicella rhizophila TaxID=3050082 RepID=A0ABU3Q9P6_9SPHN|nr:serine hydrolase domain-containing protein [Sphingosinicella sp. GR2756]MDT9600135.1 serine hydrolase domain-containing protein [Sphingosinicella sp. GR2756]
MSRLHRLLGLCLLALFAVAAPAQARDRFDPVRSYISDQLKDGSIPSVAVAVVENGRVVWEEGFGWANREKRIKADPDTLYSLASISKPITATAIMTLVEAGKIDLDAPANDYLGFAKLTARVGDARAATVRNVLSHSAGLPLHYQFYYVDEDHVVPSRDDTILRYAHLMTPPGEQFEYSNLGYGILDYIIARASGRAYADYMRTEVFLPLGMTHSSIDIGPGLEAYAAERYDQDGKPIPFYDFDHAGGSAVYSSARDMARFALFHMKAGPADQKAILSAAAIDAMHRPAIRSNPKEPEAFYGLGFSGNRRNGYRMISHGGGMGGVSTTMTMFPDQKSAIIVLTNSRNTLPGHLVDRIAATLFKGWKAVDPPTETKPAPLVPPAELTGPWQGKLSTYAGEVPVRLDVAQDGEVRGTFGDQATALVENPRFADGVFTGTIGSRIATSDTDLYDHKIQLKLRLRGSRLEGAATAVGTPGPRVRNALSHWLSLGKSTSP